MIETRVKEEFLLLCEGECKRKASRSKPFFGGRDEPQPATTEHVFSRREPVSGGVRLMYACVSCGRERMWGRE